MTDGNEAKAAWLGARLRQLREEKGLSMRDLAERLGDGTHFTTIGKMETGKVRMTADRIESLSSALGVTFSEIANRDYALSQMKPVPVLKPGPWQRNGDLSQATRIGGVVSPRGGPRSVAFFIMQNRASLGRSVSGYAVVDLDERDLVDGRVYMLDTSSPDGLDMMIYRSDPPRFDRMEEDTRPAFEIGDHPFVTIGCVVFEGWNL